MLKRILHVFISPNRIRDVIAHILARVLPWELMGRKVYFRLWEERGFHITEVSSYHPIPDTRTLPQKLWEQESELVGLDLRIHEQLELMQTFQKKYADEYEQFPRQKTDDPYQYHLNNGWFESVDAEILYCMIRHHQPKRIIEVGAGYSTYLMVQACKQNIADGIHPATITTIDPTSVIFHQQIPGVSQFIKAPVQEMPLEPFLELEAHDILFIDSSHVVKIGSDVVYELLEIVPRIAVGVVIHFHDIFWPCEYPQEWVFKSTLFWNEQYALQAFLAFNNAFKILWTSNYLNVHHPDALDAAFGSYRWYYHEVGGFAPGSVWIQRVQ